MEATKSDKRLAIKTAKQLFYSDRVIERLKQAKTKGEIERIMIAGRKEKYPDEV